MSDKNKRLLAWHFAREDKVLDYADGRKIRVGVRQKYRPVEGVDGIELCRAGMHASTNIIDALRYAHGPTICRVELSGKMLDGGDKWVAEYRKVLWLVNDETLLRRFACRCALDVADKWNPPKIVMRYLRTQNESIRAAAWDAASAAASAAAWDAASAAAWAAASDAASDAASAAARAAASAAARAAVRAAAWAAASDAASDAASAAAWAAQCKRLLQMVHAEHRRVAR